MGRKGLQSLSADRPITMSLLIFAEKVSFIVQAAFIKIQDSDPQIKKFCFSQAPLPMKTRHPALSHLYLSRYLSHFHSQPQARRRQYDLIRPCLFQHRRIRLIILSLPPRAEWCREGDEHYSTKPLDRYETVLFGDGMTQAHGREQLPSSCYLITTRS